MFGHFPELVIVLVIALIVFGPERLPEFAANLGKMVREVRETMEAAMNPEEDYAVPEDFSTYYYESMARSGEDEVADEGEDHEDDADLEQWQLTDQDRADLEAIPVDPNAPVLEPTPINREVDPGQRRAPIDPAAEGQEPA
jgi:sec-independent protein translocase protein TatB